jgi:dGTPase
MREKQEQWEREYLSPYACLSSESMGRDVEEPQCDLRTVYQRDRDRILHCKAFRRLKHKTQVFLEPEGDHYRTRLTHTLEVAQNARTIARALRLNEDLTEAIALGHDLGHTPFGHAGERTLNELSANGFHHNEQSIRVVEKLEKKGQGLNLTKEVRDGILNHQTKCTPSTLEGKVVRLSDKIAYINHDIDDAIRAHILTEDDIPEEYTQVLGHSVRARINTMIHDIILNSEGKRDILMSERVQTAVMGLRRFMYQSVYTNSVAKVEEKKVKKLISELYDTYMNDIGLLPEEYRNLVEHGSDDKERIVCDYIAGMTDRYAVHSFQQIFIPRAWSDV